MQSSKHIVITVLLGFIGCINNSVAPKEHIPVPVTIAIEGEGTLAEGVGDTVILSGEPLKLTAIPDSGFWFVGWYGDINSTDNPLRLVPRTATSVIAKFTKRPAAEMIGIDARGKTFTMGRSGSTSPELLPHKVHFTYSFMMDQNEITQKQFSNLMGYNPAVDNAYEGSFGVGDSFPVYYVSWYEAIQYCNARSKAAGYDTVYSYSGRCPTGDQCSFVLENLTINYDRFGYRLPTEAEWEYAYRGGSSSPYFWGDEKGIATHYAWYQANANGKSQKIGQLNPNNFGIYDIAGNVAEWVNDWLGDYPDSLCTDPIGPDHLPQHAFEDNWQRPIRGGSWLLGGAYLQAASRTDPYPVAAQTTAKHIGFRTVLGSFFPKRSYTRQDTIAQHLDLKVEAHRSNLHQFMGTSQAKLVFTVMRNNQRSLCYVDFSDPELKVQLLEDSYPVYQPVISPNGELVAYSSKGEGITTPSVMTIRSLRDTTEMIVRSAENESAFLPRWWVDPTTSDTFLVYSDAAPLNSRPEWEQSSTFKRKFAGGMFDGPAEFAVEKGSYHGGMSWDGQFIATGYPKAYVYDRRLDHRIRYFVPPRSGLHDTVQVCNVSITPSRAYPDQILLLDFGSHDPGTVVGRPYGLHEIIFRCNSSVNQQEHVVDWYAVPQPFKSWDDVEWTNHPTYATAVARFDNPTDPHSIFLIHLEKGNYVKLLSGHRIQDPWLWINPSYAAEELDPYADFGKYGIPGRGAGGQVYLARKLRLFWKRRLEVECIAVGSSPVFYGVDPNAITTLNTMNLGTCAASTLTATRTCTDYALPHAPNLRAIIMSLDPGHIDYDENPDDPYLIGLYDSRGYQFDQKNNHWREGIPAPVQAKIAQYDSASSWPEFDRNGYQYWRSPGNGWGDTVIDKSDYFFNDTVVQRNLSHISALADSCSNRKIHLFVVNFPQNPLYHYSIMIGRYGPSKQTYKSVKAYLETRAKQNPYFHFWDANEDGQHDFSDAEALDANHLNYIGAKRFSGMLDSLLQQQGLTGSVEP
ncbi:MAG: SUMF1/EgtB/PvdO family nonheme iron enzyme [Chitinivibrionales bacterium]|nr:SUMF1/EgtB/PvdO family nonheme iron enzyme [Chitinivibrionales bacterium]MBD3356332.1 SUMF1/EgtB/PvdO family nonheme iron enzyme [Chitinivibrionales bacterium]